MHQNQLKLDDITTRLSRTIVLDIIQRIVDENKVFYS